MKHLHITLIAILTTNIAFSADQNVKEQVICKNLYQQAKTNCEVYMCEEYEQNNDGECVFDGDFWEGHGICVNDSEWPELIKSYNKKHPRFQINCENLDF